MILVIKLRVIYPPDGQMTAFTDIMRTSPNPVNNSSGEMRISPEAHYEKKNLERSKTLTVYTLKCTRWHTHTQHLAWKLSIILYFYEKIIYTYLTTYSYCPHLFWLWVMVMTEWTWEEEETRAEKVEEGRKGGRHKEDRIHNVHHLPTPPLHDV